MGANQSDSDPPEKHLEMESLLKRLQPTPVECRLQRRLETLAARAANASKPHRTLSDPASNPVDAPIQPPPPAHPVQWRRLIPLALAGSIAILAYFSFQHRALDIANLSAPEIPPPSLLADSAEKVTSLKPLSPASIEGDDDFSHFRPVSAEKVLVNSVSQGFVETQHGPREKRTLEYRDAYHWHDPSSGTHIRYFAPRSEEITVPLQTH